MDTAQTAVYAVTNQHKPFVWFYVYVAGASLNTLRNEHNQRFGNLFVGKFVGAAQKAAH
jgi:hypothetical protein